MDEFINQSDYQVAAALGDISNSIGIINTGNRYSANGANLKLNKSSGTSTQIGLNWKTSKKSPNIVTDPALTAPFFVSSWRNGTGGFTTYITDTIVPGKYDNNTA